MDAPISIWGIETNNLKNIDVRLVPNAVNLLIGPSGSGKSSLAYDTIAQIGYHEFMSMFADNISEPAYRIKGYENMLPAVPIKQSNYNNNIRSTIGTYFGISRSIILIYAAMLNVSEERFILNKEENFCSECHGLGFKKILDKNRIINYDIPLRKNPFRCWNRFTSFYTQIIERFCFDYKIDSNKTFRQISEQEKELLLYGESEKKYLIRYKASSRMAQRTTKYYGVMTGIPMLPKYNLSEQFFSDCECEICHGEKYSSELEQYSLFDLSIGKFMVTPFEQLISKIEQIRSQCIEPRLQFAINSIYDFVRKANELGLGHLFFHRAIPTLSGGELQRLRLIQVLNTQLSNLLLVLDEPLSGLSGSEKSAVYNSILHLAKQHTLLIVDHSDAFYKISKNILALGKEGGKNGGYLINAREYMNQERIERTISVKQPIEITHVLIDNCVYQYNGVNLHIGINSMNLITGHSGIGKSTLLREYFPQFFKKYQYVSAKPLLGSKNNTVATTLNLFPHILDLFAQKFKKNRSFFSNQYGGDGICSKCKGIGYLEYGSSYDGTVRLECSECSGTGFSKKLKKYKLSGKNIYDVWNMTIDELSNFLCPLVPIPITNEAKVLMLGHLKLGQPVSTLSGGESIRIRLLKATQTGAEVLGIDEPFKGLSNSEIFNVVQYLDYLRTQGRTIIVADHSERISHFFARHIELINEKHILSEND